jgi:hypothetical protein
MLLLLGYKYNGGLWIETHFMRFSLSGGRRQYFAGGNPV